MNYLAHLHLGGSQPAQLLGSLYGDFVKGPLAGRWPADVEAAIRLHRRIDAFTDSHPLVHAAKLRFPAGRRRLAGVLLDVFFDHCLARDWDTFSNEPLSEFTRRVYGVLNQTPQLPERLARIAPRMAAQDWLGSYRDFAVLQDVLAGMARRLSRPGLLDGAWEELAERYQVLSDDFRAFYPQLLALAGRCDDLPADRPRLDMHQT
ncbi:Acyl carrier protein phosphodiesterase [Pseudomonas delhiensis]|uniref:Acyl carrier protein phosphodiesterase n=1 Tax=Pseudomonas delhiensis TaxID=366289 RepID=A0A239ECK4_9PSED|nr:ACP phosphodiesterase [Pseudomonas delhiensis]SDI31700.1 Acyl carrier protein phosphodiesterase [Pseudomonas delhiensis]SNS42181.1 Acyl carrier protein phosphodiesterase [Pseudomonas delhiensis]